MADSFTPNLNLRKPEVSGAIDTWGGVAGLNGDLDLIDAVFLATGLGTSVGLHVGTGKKLNVEGQLQIADSTDTTKRATFSADLIPTATTINLALPPAGGTIATKEILVATVTASHPVGTVLSGYYGPTPPSGYVFLWGTIGDATSLATNRANADCERLFLHLWTITANAQCPVTPGGRGASAAADWAAHKQLALPAHAGRGMVARDNLSGTAAGILSGFNAPGLVGGVQSTSAGISGGTSGSLGVSVSGSLSGSASANATAGGGSDAGPLCGGGAPVTVSGSLSGGTSGGLTVGGGTAAFSVIQPSIAVDVIIAL